MKTHITVILILLGASLCQVKAVSSGELEGSWEAYDAPLHRKSGEFGRIKWNQIIFSGDDQVEWRWERDGKKELHTGRYLISIDPVEKADRPEYVISIIPKTMGDRLTFGLRHVIIDHDSRFNLPEKVLKCHDFDGVQIIFRRQENKLK